MSPHVVLAPLLMATTAPSKKRVLACLEANEPALPVKRLRIPDVRALKAVADNDGVGLARLIQQGAKLSVQDPAGQTPLHLCTPETSPAVVELLLRNGADLNAKDLNGVTPLYKIVAHAPGKPVEEMARMTLVLQLLEAGADIDLAEADGRTPLHAAVSHDNLDMFKLLVVRGASLSKADKLKCSAVDAAIMAGDRGTKFVQWLLETGVLDAATWRNMLDCSMLHMAVTFYNDSKSLLTVLVRNGADPMLRDGSGLTAYELATRLSKPAAFLALCTVSP